MGSWGQPFIISEALLISLEQITLTIILVKNSWKVQGSMYLMEPQPLNIALEEMRHCVCLLLQLMSLQEQL